MSRRSSLQRTSQIVVKNTTVLFVSQAVSLASSVVFTIAAARLLGNVGFGQYGVIISFTSIFFALGDLKLSFKAARDVARNRALESTYLSNLLPLRIMLAFLVVVLEIIVLSLVPLQSPDIAKITVIFALGRGLDLASLGVRWWFQASQELQYEALLIALANVLKAVGGILVLQWGGGLAEIGWTRVGIFALQLGLGYTLLRRRVGRIRWAINLRFWYTILIENWPFALGLIFVQTYIYVDKIMLSALCSNQVVGWYNAAQQIIVPLKIVPMALSLAILPAFSELHGLDLENFKRLLTQVIRMVFILVLPMVIGISVIAGPIMELVFGTEYVNGSQALTVLAWSLLFSFLGPILGKAVIGSGNERFNALFTGIGLVVNLTSNVVLIPRLAHVGAAISVLLSEGVVTLLAVGWGWRQEFIKPNLLIKEVAKPVLASLLMGLAVYVGKWLSLEVWLLVAAGVAVYFVAMLLIKGFTRQDLLLAKQAVRGGSRR